jgi:ribosomal protein L24
MVAAFCPDNLQVTAMRIEIETMRSKNKNGNSSSESESEDDYNEEAELNFSNLKKIDRKSCSIVVDPLKQRKSRVTISGDTAIEYESEEVYEKSNNSTSVSKEQNAEKYLKTFKEI